MKRIKECPLCGQKIKGIVFEPTLAKGVRNGNSRLTEEQVRKIRSEWAKGKVFQWQLAKKYKVSQSQIGAIVTRKKWTHI